MQGWSNVHRCLLKYFFNSRPLVTIKTASPKIWKHAQLTIFFFPENTRFCWPNFKPTLRFVCTFPFFYTAERPKSTFTKDDACKNATDYVERALREMRKNAIYLFIQLPDSNWNDESYSFVERCLEHSPFQRFLPQYCERIVASHYSRWW